MFPIHLDRIAQAFARVRPGQERGSNVSPVLGALEVQEPVGTPSTDEGSPIPTAETGPTMLFVQSFRRGSIFAKPNDPETFTIVLEEGLGQTIAFSDRPNRDVGTIATPVFLDTLGFEADNPPNAALVLETAAGESDIAVVELLNPTYDETTHTATYDIKVLANWENSLELGFTEAPIAIGDIAATFGNAHVLIDSCPDGDIYCYNGKQYVNGFNNHVHGGYCYQWSTTHCLPCTPWFDDYDDMVLYWARRCNESFPAACAGNCRAYHLCSASFNCPGAHSPND